MAIRANIKGKKKHKNKPTSKKYTKYKIEGDKLVREKDAFLIKAKKKINRFPKHYRPSLNIAYKNLALSLNCLV